MSEAIWRGKRAFVVEDEAMISMMLEDMLEDLDCTVAGVAARLEKALEMAANVAADFAIIDLNLDGSLTYEVADRLAERGVPFVFSTGYGATALPERFRAVPSLGKPFGPRELEKAIAQALRPAG